MPKKIMALKVKVNILLARQQYSVLSLAAGLLKVPNLKHIYAAG
jgi:hypothetical protein